MVSNERNGKLIGAIQVLDGEEIMLISDHGTLVRTRVDEVSSLSRNTQGVMLIRLAKDETLVGLERVQEPTISDDDEVLEDAEQGTEETSTTETPVDNQGVVSEDEQALIDESNTPEE